MAVAFVIISAVPAAKRARMRFRRAACGDSDATGPPANAARLSRAAKHVLNITPEIMDEI